MHNSGKTFCIVMGHNSLLVIIFDTTVFYKSTKTLHVVIATEILHAYKSVTKSRSRKCTEIYNKVYPASYDYTVAHT